MTETAITILNIAWLSIPLYPSIVGTLVIILVIALVGFIIRKFPHSRAALIIDMMYEGMYGFFEEVLWDSPVWLKKFITNMFFVFLWFNLFSVFIDFVSPLSGYSTTDWEFLLAGFVAASTATIAFNVVAATISVLIILGMQFDAMPWKNMAVKFGNLLYEYFPLGWKGILKAEPDAGTFSKIISKFFDIVLSLFIGFLDFVGIFAKVISLSLRLFWNMLSGTILITVLISGLWAITYKYLWVELAPVVPLILYAQGLLVACIQALVFPLLVAIFVKVATLTDEEEEEIVWTVSV